LSDSLMMRMILEIKNNKTTKKYSIAYIWLNLELKKKHMKFQTLYP
jgi:hypothetical protein